MRRRPASAGASSSLVTDPQASAGRSQRCPKCGCLHDYGCLTCSCTCSPTNGGRTCRCCGATDPA